MSRKQSIAQGHAHGQRFWDQAKKSVPVMTFAVPLLALAMSMLIQPSLAELPVPLAYHYVFEILMAIIVVLVAVLCCLHVVT